MKTYKDTEPDHIPLWRFLDLDEPFSCEDVDNAYSNNGFDDERAILAWKVLRDAYFCGEYKKHGTTERIFESGFFDDGLTPASLRDMDYSWARTPIYKIRRNLNRLGRGGRCAVLLMTGAFSPIHKGHVLCMEAAKEELERRHIRVVGGYISPSHDAYVETKDGGRTRLDARKRLALCRMAVKDSRWLMVDGWESLCATVPVTFALVYDRLKNYLTRRFHGTMTIDVYFVVGSDNAAYARAFADLGHCVCVERFGYGKKYKQISAELEHNQRIIFVGYEDWHLRCSSSSVRRGGLRMLDDIIRDRYRQLRSFGDRLARK